MCVHPGAHDDDGDGDDGDGDDGDDDGVGDGIIVLDALRQVGWLCQR